MFKTLQNKNKKIQKKEIHLQNKIMKNYLYIYITIKNSQNDSTCKIRNLEVKI